MLCDREIQVDSVTFEEREDLPASQEGVYISFRFAFDNDGAEEHGTLLIPLAESISLGGNLMLKYEEGAPLIVGRAALRMGADAPVQMVLVLPVAAMRAGA